MLRYVKTELIPPWAGPSMAGQVFSFGVGVGIGIDIVSIPAIPENLDRIIYGVRPKSFPMLLGNCKEFL